MIKLSKLFTLLFVLSVCFTLTAQQYEASPYQGSTVVTGEDAIWDLLFAFDVTASSGAAGNAGAEYANGFYYTTRWASNLIHEYDATGTMVREFSIPGVSGLRDLAYDGTYFYGGASTATIYQMDFATETLVGQFNVTGGITVRNIAYDEVADGFWCGNWADPPTLFDRTGTQLNQIVTGLTSQYGSAYDNVSPGGPYLWLFDQGGTSQIIVHQWDIATGLATGVTHDVGLEATDPTGIAGGLWLSTDHTPGFLVMGALAQGVPDEMLVYEIAPAGGGTLQVPFIDDFDSYTVGGQLACQDPINWSTWSNLPCDPVEDAFISSNYAFNGTNSAVFVQNNDVIKPFGGQTTGVWDVGFMVYIPAGKAGYFNLMAEALVLWDIEVYFDVGGTGRALTGLPDVAFPWVEDTWQQVRIVVDLDTDNAKFTLDGNLIVEWAWTNGTSGPCPLVLDVADIFGGTINDEMYVDQFMFGQFPFVPVELTSFTANVNQSGQVELNWSTASELNNQMFEIERRTSEGQFATIGYVEGHGTTTEPQHYNYTDATVNTGIYYYRLKQLDFLGSYEYFDAIEVDVNGPLTFDLEQNYPNPFNPSTNIKFSVPESGIVRLAVYNLIGEEVAVLVDGVSEAGFFEVTFDASSLASGTYIYKLQSGNSVVAKKMLLMK